MVKAALYTAGAIFTVGAVAHAVRLVAAFDIVVDGIHVPQWASLPALIAAALLAAWMLLAARRV
jgi:hypothetical protein